MNEKDLPQASEPIKSSNNVVVILVIIFTALIAGIGLYLWQGLNFNSRENSLQEQIVLLQDQIKQLQLEQQSLNQQPVSEASLAQEQSNQSVIYQMENVNESLDLSPEIVYSNTQYGFNLTFPQTWTGYTAKNRVLNWGSLGTSNSVDFGFPAQDSLFNVSMHTKNQWQQIKSEAGPSPVYLGEDSNYVFAYAMGQYAVNDNINERMKEVMDIVKTFEIIQ